MLMNGFPHLAQTNLLGGWCWAVCCPAVIALTAWAACSWALEATPPCYGFQNHGSVIPCGDLGTIYFPEMLTWPLKSNGESSSFFLRLHTWHMYSRLLSKHSSYQGYYKSRAHPSTNPKCRTEYRIYALTSVYLAPAKPIVAAVWASLRWILDTLLTVTLWKTIEK